MRIKLNNQSINQSTDPIDNKHICTCTELLDTEICVKEIEAAMKAIKHGKSGGPDVYPLSTSCMAAKPSKCG